MLFHKIKSHAKINMALNIIGKNYNLHKIESIVGFVQLHDEIYIKRIKSNSHNISFRGKFSKNISAINTVSKLLNILDKKKFLSKKKFHIIINKKIPNKAGLGGGSMNAATILKFLFKKKFIKIKKGELKNITKLIGSDVILGLNTTNSIINAKNEIKCFKNYNKIYVLIVKPEFGCSTKKIYSKVSKFTKSKFFKPRKKMFNLNYLKKMNNSLEQIVLSKFPKLKKVKLFLENLSETIFVRMTGSGSALVAYFQTKKSCDIARKQFKKKYKNYWCITSKTI